MVKEKANISLEPLRKRKPILQAIVSEESALEEPKKAVVEEPKKAVVEEPKKAVVEE